MGRKKGYYFENEEVKPVLLAYKEFAERWFEEKGIDPAERGGVTPPMEGFPKLGEAIMKLATHFVQKKNWQDSVLDQDDMVSAIAFEIMRYAHKYDPERGTPFTFFTMIAESAARRLYKKKLNDDEKIRRFFERKIEEEARWLAYQGFTASSDIDELIRAGFTDDWSEVEGK